MFVGSIQTRFVGKCFLLIQVMVATLVLEADCASGGLSSETVYNELISGKRQILTIGKLSSKIILLVAQSGGKQFEDTFVFEIEASDDKLSLDKGSLLSDKWPEFQKEFKNVHTVFLLSDSKYGYVMVFHGGPHRAYAFEIEKGKGFKMAKLKKANTTNPMMSAIKKLTSYSFSNGKGKYLHVHKYDYSDDHGRINANKTKMNNTKEFYLCKDGDNVVIRKKECSKSFDWNIQNGFVDEKSATLFSKDGNVYRLPKISSENVDKTFKVEQFKMKDFFVFGGKSDNSNTSTANGTDNATQAVTKVASEAGSSKVGLIIGIVVAVIVVVLLVVTAAICCFCKSKDKKKNAKAKASGTAQVAGKDRKGNKSRGAVRSGRSSAGKASRRTPRVSSVANSRAAALRSQRRTGRKSSRLSSKRSSAASSRALSSRRSSAKSSRRGSQAANSMASSRAIQSSKRTAGKTTYSTFQAISDANSRGALSTRHTPGKSLRASPHVTSAAKSSRQLQRSSQRASSQRVTAKSSRRSMPRTTAQQTSSMAKSSRRPLSKRASTSRASTRMTTTRQSTSRVPSQKRTSVRPQSRAKSSRRTGGCSSAKPW